MFSLATSFIGMFCASASYFAKNKVLYFIFQGSSILFILLSNFSLRLYFACITGLIALIRVAIYIYLEKKDKKINFTIKTIFALINIASYFVLNIIILKNYSIFDLMLLAVNVSFIYLVAIKNIRVMRYSLIVPLVLSVAYCIIVGTAIFTTISCTLEIVANMVAIIVYEIKQKKNKEFNN